MKIKAIIIFSFLLVYDSMAQFVSQEWVRVENRRNSSGKALALDSLQNVYVGGVDHGYSISKYTPDGNRKWITNYTAGFSLVSILTSIAVDRNGNVYATGYDFGMTTIKLDSNGTILWTKRYDLGAGYYNSNAIALDDSGNVYVTGGNYSNMQHWHYVTIKYKPNGETAWVTTYFGPGNWFGGIAFDIKLDNKRNIYITGRSSTDSTKYLNMCTIKYDNNGKMIWVNRYNENLTSWGKRLFIDSNNNVYVVGKVSINPTEKLLLIKYDEDGNVIWERIFDQFYTTFPLDMSFQNNIYITGFKFDSSGSYDYLTVKYDTSGNLHWYKTYDGPSSGDDIAISIDVDDKENVYVTGSQNVQYGIVEFCTIKYNGNGEEKWKMTYRNPIYNYSLGERIIVDKNYNVYVTGQGKESGTLYNITTVKYSQTASIINNQNMLVTYRLHQNSPNPFNPVTSIKFDIAKSGNVKLVIFDLLGREVSTLVNENLNPGTYQVSFDGSSFSSGVYFYKLSADGIAEMKRMVMVK